jgi:hypothetical protein
LHNRQWTRIVLVVMDKKKFCKKCELCGDEIPLGLTLFKICVKCLTKGKK